MNMDSLLHTDREGVRKLVLRKLDITEDEVQKDIQLMKNWLHCRKHLPEVPSDIVIEAFLIVNKFNLEKTKKKLETYYTIRKEIPDMYVDKNPKLQHMVDIANTVYNIPLPKLTPSLSRVTVIKLKDTNSEKFNSINYFAHTYNFAEIRLREDVMLTDTFVYDLEGFSLGHIVKLRIGPMRKAATILEKVFSSRVEGIHYINLPTSMITVLNILKPMLKEKIRKRIYIHKDLKSLQNVIPNDVLPKDFGGSGMSLNELHGLWKKKIEYHQDLFDYLDTLAPSKETYSAPTNEDGDDQFIASVNSDFRNLSVD